MKNLMPLFLLFTSIAFVGCKTELSNNDKKTDEKPGEVQNQLKTTPADVEANNIPATTIEFSDISYDFGTVKEGDIVETSFTIKNTGDKPLIINNATATCGCTVPKIDKNVPIAPGESTEALVRFNTSGKPNKQTKVVSVFGNFSPNPSKFTLSGNVTPKATVQ